MGQARLPHNYALIKEGGVWILRKNEDLIGQRDGERGPWRNLARIGFATGSAALTERDAQHLARRYLLSQLSPGSEAQRSQLTVAEFVETRFVPEFVTAKNLAGRAHYYSILKHVLTPEEVNRIIQVDCSSSAAKLTGHPDWPYLSNLRLRSVRPEHVQRLISAASEKGYSPQTVKHIRSVISAIFSYAKQELVFMGANPADPVEVPAAASKSIPALTLSQTEQVLRAMRYPEKEMTMIALLTDMNASEICGLQGKCVNLTGAWSNSHIESITPISIAVIRQLSRGELSNVKESRRRNIQIPEVLLSMLLLLRGRSRFTGPEDFVLTSRSGTAINVTNITARRLNLIGRKLEMPGLSWQVFRRAHVAMREAFGSQFQYHMAAAVTPDWQQNASTPKIRRQGALRVRRGETDRGEPQIIDPTPLAST
jgi:integrase